MNDFERLMRDSLKSVGEEYRPSDPDAAKAELFRRRRQRKIRVWAGGAVAVGATAALAFVAFVVLGPAEQVIRPTPPTVTPAVSGREPDVNTIRVGDGANGISVGSDGYAWAIGSEARALVRIDPLDNSVERIDIGVQEPEDVLAAHGVVWVTDPPTGRVIRYDPSNGHSNGDSARAVLGDPDTDFDLAAGENDDVWVLESEGDLHHLAADSGEVIASSTVGESVVDVSSSGSEVWLYDQGAGEVIEWDPALEEITTRADVGIGSPNDLVAGLRHVWFYRGNDGKLLQIDKESGDVVKEFDVGGSFAGLSIAGNRLWAMVTTDGGPEDGEGRLYQIDVNKSAEIAEPIPVPDNPYDVAAGYGSVWVTNNDTGEVTRVSFGQVTATGPHEVVFYYSDGNDIWAYDSDSQSTQVTNTPEPELSPTIARDGHSLVFQRGDGSGSEVPRIVRLELDTRVETDLGPGVAPAYGGPMGRLALALPPEPGGEPSRIVIVYGDDTVETIDLPSELGSVRIERIAWSLFDNALYLQTATEEPQIFAFDLAIRDPVPVVPRDAEPGTVLVSPSVDDEVAVGMLTAIELCCGQYPDFDFTTAELGWIAGDPVTGPGWEPFEAVVGIDDVFRSPPGFELYAVPASNLDFDEDQGWTTNEHGAWFVGDGNELWLVDDSSSGLKDRMPLGGVQGIAVNPLFLNE